MARIARVGHVVLNVRDTREAIDWYTSALGMELMNHDQGMDMAFLSFGVSDHDIALIKAPEGVETGSPGLSHTALQLEGGEPELQQMFGRVKDAGYESTSPPTTASPRASTALTPAATASRFSSSTSTTRKPGSSCARPAQSWTPTSWKPHPPTSVNRPCPSPRRWGTSQRLFCKFFPLNFSHGSAPDDYCPAQ